MYDSLLFKLKKTQLALFFAIGFFMFSCSQYDLKNNKQFDYKSYEYYLNNSPDISTSVFSRNSSNIDELKQVVIDLNIKNNTNVVFPEIIYEMASMSLEDLEKEALANNFLNANDFIYIKSLVDDLKEESLDTAIKNLETLLNNSNVDEVTFNKYNTVVNTLKIIDSETDFLNFESYNITEYSNRSILRCIAATIAWISALYSVLACATVILCPVVIGLSIYATVTVVEECVGDSPDEPWSWGWSP